VLPRASFVRSRRAAPADVHADRPACQSLAPFDNAAAAIEAVPGSRGGAGAILSSCPGAQRSRLSSTWRAPLISSSACRTSRNAGGDPQAPPAPIVRGNRVPTGRPVQDVPGSALEPRAQEYNPFIRAGAAGAEREPCDGQLRQSIRVVLGSPIRAAQEVMTRPASRSMGIARRCSNNRV
jgi:hypothetical protein